MYEVNGIRFRVQQRTEEGLYTSRKDIYDKLQEHKIEDEGLWLRYDDVVKLFEPSHPYGKSIEELRKQYD